MCATTLDKARNKKTLYNFCNFTKIAHYYNTIPPHLWSLTPLRLIYQFPFQPFEIDDVLVIRPTCRDTASLLTLKLRAVLAELLIHHSGSQFPQRTVARIINQAMLKKISTNGHIFCVQLEASSYLSTLPISNCFSRNESCPSVDQHEPKLNFCKAGANLIELIFETNRIGWIYPRHSMMRVRKYVHRKSRANRHWAHQ